MQHPVGYEMQADGTLALNSFWSLILNPWLVWQYLHSMMGAVTTGAFAMASVGAYYVLVGGREHATPAARGHAEFGRMFLRTGVLVGLPATLLVAFPTGDFQAVNVARSQPAAFASVPCPVGR